MPTDSFSVARSLLYLIVFINASTFFIFLLFFCQIPIFCRNHARFYFDTLSRSSFTSSKDFFILSAFLFRSRLSHNDLDSLSRKLCFRFKVWPLLLFFYYSILLYAVMPALCNFFRTHLPIFLPAISLQIAWPLPENFCSYSVMILPAERTGS